MQASQYYENLIIEGIRRKTEQPERFAHDRENALLAVELKQLGMSETEHLVYRKNNE